jgi:hypothetical protein
LTRYEINKFPPSLFRHVRFRRADWTACTDIGARRRAASSIGRSTFASKGLDPGAVAALARTVKPDPLPVNDVEFWDTASDRLANFAA